MYENVELIFLLKKVVRNKMRPSFSATGNYLSSDRHISCFEAVGKA
jgi:hypothetical protein